MGRFIKAILFIIVLLFLTTFGVKNNQSIRLNYYFDIMPGEIPLYAMVYVMLVIGVVVGLFVDISKRFSQGRTIRGLRRKNNELKSRVKSLEEKKVETIDKMQSTDASTEK